VLTLFKGLKDKEVKAAEWNFYYNYSIGPSGKIPPGDVDPEILKNLRW